MIWIKLIKKLIKALNADVSPSELALGISLGAILGLTPLLSLHNVVIVFLILVLKVNIQASIFSMILYSVVGFIVDPIAHMIGLKLLLNESLNSFWLGLSMKPLYPLMGLNNTVTLGSLVLALLLFIPNFFFFKWFVVFYRKNLQEKVEKIKFVKLLKTTKLYGIYERYSK